MNIFDTIYSDLQHLALQRFNICEVANKCLFVSSYLFLMSILVVCEELNVTLLEFVFER